MYIKPVKNFFATVAKYFMFIFILYMKITNINPYIKFASDKKNELPEKMQSSDNIADKKEKRDKIIKYSIAAAATAAVIIGGLYYIGKHGKKPPSASDVNIKPKNTPQTKMQEVPVEKPASSSVEPPKKEQNIEKTKQERINTETEPKVVKNETTEVSNKPFDISDEYFDFAKLKGEREDNVVRQFENGKLVREFYSEDNKHLTIFSEFDAESGFRLHDVEYRPDRTVKSVKEYSDNEFSKMTVYEKDGITIKQVFNDEDSALLYELDNA